MSAPMNHSCCGQGVPGLRASVVTVIVLAASLAGCSAAAPLRVATSGDYPPFSVTTPYGAIVGLDIDVAAQFMRDTGRGMNFVALRWPQLNDLADVDGFDVAMSGVTVRADRMPHMLFSRPYAVTGAVVAVRRERAAELGSLEQIDRPGIRIAVNRGGHLERVARSQFVQATVLTVDDNRGLADRVLRDEVDAALSDDLEVGAWPVEALAIVGPLTRDRKAYAVPPGQTKLLGELNEWLATRESDGWLNGQRSRWLSSAALWTPDQACFEAIAAAIDMRLLLMPQVAIAKRQQNLPIEDPVQEEKVLRQVAQWAADEGIDPEAVVVLFRRLIVAAKEIQGTVDARAASLDGPDLDSLRGAVGFYSHSLVKELRRCQFSLARSEAQASLVTALRSGEAFGDDESALAEDLAVILTGQHRPPTPTPSPAVVAIESTAGTYVDFCIPPNLRFDLEGYAAEEIVEGQLLTSGLSRELRSGYTRVAVTPGRHEYRLYVNGSSGDPRRTASPGDPPSRVAIEVPDGRVVTVRFAPRFSASGAFELRWQDVYGAAAGGLDAYRGLTRFDVDVAASAPASPDERSPCP